MASMRVHELAKEFDMSSKELLDRIRDMKIAAKSHASVLADADVETIRKNIEPEIRARAGALAAEEEAALKKEQEEAARAKAEEEAARRAAVEAELAEREAARARRESAKAEEEAAAPAPRKAPQAPSAFASLEQQIAAEKERVEREREEARARARAEKAAAEVAKKRAVEEALRQGHKKHSKAAAPAPEAPKAPAPAPAARPKNNFDSLLSQIEAEKQRMEAQQAAAAEAKKAARGAGGKRGKKGGAHQVVPELEMQAATGDDRYAQMAVQAEKLQRDKVLAEARAAVEAANTHEGEGRRKKRKEKREAEARERAELEAIERGLDPTLVLDDSVVEIPQGATVAKFAELLGVQPNEVIKRLFMLGQVLTLTQSMNDETMELIADDMGRKVRVVSPEEEYAVVYNDSEDDLKPRPPVVTVMGHVDHGKTSLLDAIRHTGVVASEAGGITQHIGASVVNIDGRQITFIDTPGHEAFTAMRARGAQVTDVIVLVVAADDGVMPQTIEAINHAKAAEVPIVVAVNKIDKPGANPDRVRQELTEYGVIPEEWGGSNMFVEVSAKKNLHIDDLLETILLQADVLELKANPDAEASGFVIEANLDKGRGPVATVLIQRGTLHTGDVVVAGTSYGRVRALVNPRGEHVSEAKPADPVEILGLNSVPTAGDEFRVFEDERDARKLAEERALRARLAAQETKSHMSLDDLFSRIEEGKQTDLNLIVKADVQGSIEALRDAFEKMDQSEVRINIVHSAVGGITETDVTLAAASDAIIIGFNVRPTGKSRQQAEKEKVDIRLYRVIYQAIEDINAARVGLLSPDIVEEDTGIAEVRETFKVPKVGTIAGCYIVEGEINRDDKVRIVRDGTVIFEGVMASLRRFKDDVKTVKQGYECGIGIEKFQDLKVGDTIEGYQVKEVERTE
ncbi:translation initiation factor IF-2 [uncultured Adlercreutzia sp.]|uniref:translation initiation factor IF-2 n=2 Tax=uncultured Adlercreutzia sp. TaxID=875803 RepID=UPI00262501B2|nr:translation initiation factor IF-2 [uncultured Adlercreutzia sp.]MCI9261821.1 translation initiation factor IF-2 [Eggerthellaceae bacterium]